MAETKIFIADIFKSIQGEGARIGTPSLFLRLGICNLQCSWCDTPYTWKKGLTDYSAHSDRSIITELQSLHKNTGIKNIVITGGEPMLQQEQLARLLSNKFFDDFEIEFETNGSMPFLKNMQNFIEKRNKNSQRLQITFNISPKLADSGNKAYRVHNYPDSVLKFVYVSKKSEKLIDEFMKQNKEMFKKTPVFIMPEGTTLAKMSEKYENAVSYCLKRGYKFTPRLQIYLFGNTRAT